jgi:hypothetical protein
MDEVNAGAVATAAAFVLIPGVAATAAAYPPGRAGIALRLALAFGLGYAVVGLTATALVIGHVLSPGSFLAATAAVTVALAVMAVRRGGARAHLAALREELAGDRAVLLCGLAAMLAIALVRLRSSPLLDFQMFGPWRYWADGLELADAGRVPAHTLQWGALYTPTVSKIVLNSFHAGASYLIGRAPLPAMGALLWVASVGLGCALWALGRELGLRLLAPLLALLPLAVLADELRRNLDVYTAENVGRMVAVCGLAVGVRALRDREGWTDPALAALLFGAGFATHGVPVVALMLGLGCYGVVLLALEPPRREVAVRMAAIAAASPAVTVALLLSAGGAVGFQGAAGNDRYAAFGANVDPTASLLAGAVRHSPTGTGHWYVPPHGILESFLQAVTTLDRPPHVLLYLLPAAAVAVAGAMAWRAAPALRAAAPAGVALAACLVAIAFVFSYRYRTRIPGRFGIDREFDYLPLAGLWIALAAAEWGLGALRRVRAWAPVAVATAVVLVPAAAVAATGGPSRAHYRQNGVDSVAVLDWVARHVPCDARILPDRMTLGTFVAATGRVSVAEGMGPYLRPDMLHTVLAEVLAAHRFFEHPAGGLPFLRREGVDYVIAVRDTRIGSMVGTIDRGVDWTGLRAAPFLTLVHSSPLVDVYRVRGAGASGRFPSPLGRPGFDCVRGPVPAGS